MRFSQEAPAWVILGLVLCDITPTIGADSWSHYAGDAARQSVASRGPRKLDSAAWSVPLSSSREFVSRSTPVSADGRVFANAQIYEDGQFVSNALCAFDATTGGLLWQTEIDADEYSSWSSPAIYEQGGSVLIGSGDRVHALDVVTGEILWQTALSRSVVTASIVVSENLCEDDIPSNRAFVTDYGGFGKKAALYALNMDPLDVEKNPFIPGEIVWSVPLPGASGNSPAYLDGRVFVSSKGGAVFGFDARDGEPLWRTDVDAGYGGFFSGVTVQDGAVYAATYDFDGGRNNSGLFKFDAESGAELWAVACERTSSIPVVGSDGWIFLSGGVDGFGSAVTLQAFRDRSEHAERVWDTWTDTEGALRVGGWTQQPALVDGRLYLGVPPEGASFDPCTELLLLNHSHRPNDEGFVVARFAGAGGSCALANGWLYSFGTDGLVALVDQILGDANCDGKVDFADIDAFVVAVTSQEKYAEEFPGCNWLQSDINGDGSVDFDDIDLFVNCIVNNGCQ